MAVFRPRSPAAPVMRTTLPASDGEGDDDDDDDEKPEDESEEHDLRGVYG
jgi:hypothetical protein